MTAIDTDLRVLIIEDNPGDYVLIKEYLHENIKKTHLKHARTLSETKEILQGENNFDIILLDLSLPDASGESLVETIVNLSGQTPVIVLTGYENEEFSLKTLGMGIADYLLKDELNPFLLSKSISYSIERNRINQSLKQSEEKYREIFNLSPQPMWVYDLETLEFLDVNQAAIDQYGYSRDEFLNMTLKDIRAEENIPKLEEAVELSLGKEEFFFEGIFQHLTKNGQPIDVKIKSNIIDYQGCKAEMVLAEDITDQLKAEKELKVSEQKFKALVQEGAEMVAVVDQEGNYKFTSPNYEQLTGWSPNDLQGQNAFEYIHPDDRERINKTFSKLTHTPRLQTLPFRFKHKNGDWLWVESSGTNISEEASIDGFIINSHDVTERKYYTELEKVERDILEKNVIGRLNLPDLAKKLLLKIEDLHPSMRCSIQKVVDGTIRNFASPSLPSAYLEEIEGSPIGPRAGSCGSAAYLKESVIVENIFEDPRWEDYRHLGKTYNFSACWSQPVIDSNHNVLATFAMYYDSPQAPSERERNTIDRVVDLLRLLFDSYEKEKAEQELALSEHRFRSLVQEGAELIAILDEEANYKYVAPTAEAILGISADEFLGTNALDYIHQDDRERIASKLADLDKEERFEIEPFRFQDAEGNYRWIKTVVTNMLDNPAVKGIVANSRDVTDRIERKKKLQESLQRYEAVSKATNDVIWDWDFNTDTVRWNNALQTLLGYDQLKTSNQWWYDHIHPDDRDEIVQNIHDHIDEEKENWSAEYRFRCADGSYKVFYDRGFLLFDEDGEPQQMMGSMQDITERKQYEKELEQLSLVASKTTDLIVMTDPKEKITWVNQAFIELTGYSSEEAIGENPGDLLQGPETDPETTERLAKAIKNQESIQETILNYTKAGEPYWLDLTIDPIFDEEGNCEGFIAIEKEVTEQIERQKELSQSVDRYESVSKATSDTIWDLDLKTDTIEYNQNIYDMFGYEKQQVENIGDWWRNNIHPDDRPEVIETLEEALRSSTERFQMEYRFQAADGTYKYIYDRAFIVQDQEGNSIRVIGAMQNVTQQREERKWLQLFESAVGTTTESVAIIEAKPTGSEEGRRIKYVNEAFTEMTGYRREEAVDQTLHLLNGPDTDLKKIARLGQRMDNWETSEVELLNYKKNGDPFWIYVSMAPVKNRDGSYSHWVCVGRDVTDRRKRERELKHSLKEKETLLLEIHHRVKNNLAVVSGMMQLQAFEEDNERLREKLLSSVARIQTMGSIHELLYQSESFSSLAFDENINRLVENIIQTMQSGSELNIDFEVSPITLNINQAIPCSLIINEVITNIIKHAFPERERGTIQIHGYEENGEVSLTIKDNGQGLPDNFDEQKSKETLGLKLIDTLATQLESAYNYQSSSEGTIFQLTFEKAETKGIGNALL